MAAPRSKIPPRLIMIVGGVLLFMLLIHLAGVWILRYFVERSDHVPA